MKTIEIGLIKKQVNDCFEDYDPLWQDEIGSARQRNGFKYYLERTAGIKLYFENELIDGHMGYKITSVEIVDEEQFILWMLKWA